MTCGDGVYNNSQIGLINIVDTTPPRFENQSITNPVNFSDEVLINISWWDPEGIFEVLFESNYTSQLENFTPSNVDGKYFYNFTPNASGHISYKWYGNDTWGNLNSTDTQNFSIDLDCTFNCLNNLTKYK